MTSAEVKHLELWFALSFGLVAAVVCVVGIRAGGWSVVIGTAIAIALLKVAAVAADKYVTSVQIQRSCMDLLAKQADEKVRKETSHEGQEKHVGGDWRDYDADLGAGPADGL